jgi:hypothetical protein
MAQLKQIAWNREHPDYDPRIRGDKMKLLRFDGDENAFHASGVLGRHR